MSKFRFTLNRKGVSDLMKSTEMQGILEEKAENIRKRCGSGYESNVYVGKRRANAMVRTKSYQAKRDNQRNNTLLKAVR